MMFFEDIQDVKDWLAPLDYLEFWDAVAPYNLILQDRDHCDELIANGTVAPDLVLFGLKFMAVVELAEALDLQFRTYHPPIPSTH